MFCPKDIQKRYFEAQFELAEKTGLPMFLHNRNTGDDFYNILFYFRVELFRTYNCI